MRFDKTKFDEFSIRVPKELTERIQQDAERHKRSRNLQVNVILENYYNEPESDKKIVQDIAAPSPNL